jgi:hypothetical protein
MRFRKLRIAWSVAWGVFAVLLIALWVRSYWRVDDVARFQGGDMYLLESAYGSLRPVYSRGMGGPNKWHFESVPMSEAQYRHSAFGWDAADYPNYFMAYMPHWLPTLLLAALAAVPWVKWSKRFSLRTLLIATTVIAACMRKLLTVLNALVRDNVPWRKPVMTP